VALVAAEDEHVAGEQLTRLAGDGQLDLALLAREVLAGADDRSAPRPRFVPRIVTTS
jgi:hypothetical protein